MQPKPHRRFSFLALPYGKGPSQTVGEVFINTNKAPSVALSAAFHKGEGYFWSRRRLPDKSEFPCD